MLPHAERTNANMLFANFNQDFTCVAGHNLIEEVPLTLELFQSDIGRDEERVLHHQLRPLREGLYNE